MVPEAAGQPLLLPSVRPGTSRSWGGGGALAPTAGISPTQAAQYCMWPLSPRGSEFK